MYHAFLYNSLPSLHDYDVKMSKFTFCRGRERKTTTFFFCFPELCTVQFKILLLTFKSLNGLAPVYIDEMIQRYVPNRKLRSSSAFLLKQNKWNLKSYGFRTFTVAAPFLWNSLPLEVKSSPSLNIFKSKLKTHLFKCAFNLN